MAVCVLVSLLREIRLFLDALSNVEKDKFSGFVIYRGLFDSGEIKVIKTGVGFKPMQESLFDDCSLIISTGVCGAIHPDLKSGDIVIPEKVFHADKKLLRLIYSGKRGEVCLKENPVNNVTLTDFFYKNMKELLKEMGLNVHRGSTITSVEIVKSFDEKEKLHTAFNATAVDMEDYFRACFFQKLGIPIFIVRAVLDELYDEILSSDKSFRFSSRFPVLFSKFNKAQKSIAISLKKIIPEIIKYLK